MAHSPSAYDRGTRFTNYSSIHSADAFVGDYQVMYTPGSSPPPGARNNRKSTRFTRRSGSVRGQTMTQSYVLPPNMPNTSQIVPDNAGVLPNIQIRYTVPADEKQIVASLRAVQNELNDAMQTIRDLTRERDQAIQRLNDLKTASGKLSSPPKKERNALRVEEELFDLSRFEESPKKTPVRQASKKVSIAQNDASPNPASRSTRVLPHMSGAINKDTRASHTTSKSQMYKKPVMEEADQSIVGDDPTVASNTSRRRKHQTLDENMTSAYILPDITVAQPINKGQVSKEAQHVLHEHDPQHIDNCGVCQRLVARPKVAQNFTTLITEPIDLTNLEEPTMRPKISPVQALANVKRQTKNQFEQAKQKHDQAWKKYSAIPAPMSSRRHDQVSKEMLFWQERMEEFRLALDNLRDVEEGMVDDDGDV